jgi:hypothetical protein
MGEDFSSAPFSGWHPALAGCARRAGCRKQAASQCLTCGS